MNNFVNAADFGHKCATPIYAANAISVYTSSGVLKSPIRGLSVNPTPLGGREAVVGLNPCRITSTVVILSGTVNYSQDINEMIAYNKAAQPDRLPFRCAPWQASG